MVVLLFLFGATLIRRPIYLWIPYHRIVKIP